MSVLVVALFSAVLNRTCKECLRSQSATDRREVSLYDSRRGSDSTFDVIASQKFVAYSSFLLYKYRDSTCLC